MPLCYSCSEREALKTDSYGKGLCLKCLKAQRRNKQLRGHKTQRNAPCYCGSGVKYKHCCGRP